MSAAPEPPATIPAAGGEGAARAADTAALRAGLVVAELHSIAAIEAACALFSRVWGNPPDRPVIEANVVRALALSGNHVAGAFEAGATGATDGPNDLVGASVAWLGRHRGGIHLHSHVTGVEPGRQGSAAGFALKQRQRAWALARGVTTIRWTFDPLVRRNAHFNLSKLGATGVRYHVNLYGAMSDAVNAGDESDRVEVCWALEDGRATAAAESHGADPDVDALRAAGAAVVLDEGDGGEPVLTGEPGEGVLLARVPADILTLRVDDPALAREWRHAARVTIGAALDEEHVATGMTRSGWYVLTRARPEGDHP